MHTMIYRDDLLDGGLGFSLKTLLQAPHKATVAAAKFISHPIAKVMVKVDPLAKRDPLMNMAAGTYHSAIDSLAPEMKRLDLPADQAAADSAAAAGGIPPIATVAAGAAFVGGLGWWLWKRRNKGGAR